MKKIFSMAALFAAGLLGFTSCSNEDIAQGGAFSQDALAVSFAAVKTNGAVTPAKGPLLSRAAGVTTTNLTNIYVQATNSENAVYFGTGTAQDPMELFTYDGSSEFRSTVNHYWPNNNAQEANNTLNFYASNQQEALTAGTQANPSPIVDDYECDGIKDWVTATVKAGEKTIPYPLTFQHVLSQIKITAEAKDKTQDLVYKVVGVKLSAPDTGDYQFANATAGVGTWTIDNSSTADYTYEQNMNGQFNPTAATEAEQTWASTDYFNILPVTSGTLTFDVQYQVIQNGQVIGDFTGANSKQVTVDAPNLLSGKIYTYNFVLAINTNDVITFTVNTTAWGSGSTTDVQVPEIPTPLNITLLSSINDYYVNQNGILKKEWLGAYMTYLRQYCARWATLQSTKTIKQVKFKMIGYGSEEFTLNVGDTIQVPVFAPTASALETYNFLNNYYYCDCYIDKDTNRIMWVVDRNTIPNTSTIPNMFYIQLISIQDETKEYTMFDYL